MATPPVKKGWVDPGEAERMQEQLRQRLDDWAAQQPDRPNRTQAVQRIIEAIMNAPFIGKSDRIGQRKTAATAERKRDSLAKKKLFRW